MLLTDYDYCAGQEFKDKIKEILSHSFAISDFSEIERAYHIFENNFATPFCHDRQKTEKTVFVPLTNDNENFLNSYYSIDSKVGVDLPVFIKRKGKENGQTIMILGEDPLRENALPNQVELSTPYGTHHEKARNGRQKIYWLISEMLLELGYNIYYTDINKIWIKGGNRKIKIPIDLKVRFANTLHEEIAWIQPALIITFGNVAKQVLTAMDESGNNLKIISLIHPAAWAKSWKKVIEVVSNENKVKYIRDICENHIKMTKQK